MRFAANKGNFNVCVTLTFIPTPDKMRHKIRHKKAFQYNISSNFRNLFGIEFRFLRIHALGL